MLRRTVTMTAAYWYIETEYPGTPFRQLEGGPPGLQALSEGSYYERAVAVLASRGKESDPVSAVLEASAVTDPFGFPSENGTGWVLVKRGEAFTERQHRARDIAFIQKLASAYAHARAKHPGTPVGTLIGRHARWNVLCYASPRTRAIALVAVALGRSRGTWDVERAVLLIDGCDLADLMEPPVESRTA